MEQVDLKQTIRNLQLMLNDVSEKNASVFNKTIAEDVKEVTIDKELFVSLTTLSNNVQGVLSGAVEYYEQLNENLLILLANSTASSIKLVEKLGKLELEGKLVINNETNLEDKE